jgi:site-specific recombinase XerD
VLRRPVEPGQYTSIRFSERLAEAGIQPSVGAVGSSYDNALAETINGLYKTELIKPRKPWRTIEEVELATAEWVDWFGYAGDLGVSDMVRAAGADACSRRWLVVFVPCLVVASHHDGAPRLGHQLLDDYLAMVAARCRPNTVLATAFDLKVFFSVVGKEPAEVTNGDVLSFIRVQRQPRRGVAVVRLEDGEAGLAARTIKRRLASVTGLFEYLVMRGVVVKNPVPHGLSTRSPNRTVPLIRTPRTLPRVIDPDEADALLTALRTHRDRAMVLAMLLGGLRRCEVLGLRLADVHPGEKRLFIADGKGGHQRMVPVSARFFTSLADYLEIERPSASTDRVFVALKGPRRGQPLSAAGLDEIITGARRRAGIAHLTCHQLRHTCFTRLREAGMALEAIQAQAGHRSIESTRIYLHLANDWLAGEYRRAVEAIDAQAMQVR